MARYIISHRRAGKFGKHEKSESREKMSSVFSSFESNTDVVYDKSPEDSGKRRIAMFEADPSEVSCIKQGLIEDVLIEEEILHYYDSNILPEFRGVGRHSQNNLIGSGQSITLEIHGNGRPIPGASVILFLRAYGRSEAKISQTTDTSGSVTFDIGQYWDIAGAVVTPYASFWPTVERNIYDGIVISCVELPRADPVPWWQDINRVDCYNKTRGKDIRVGIIDTGLGPHDDLSHVNNVGAFISGKFDPSAGKDVAKHGTHVIGSIAAIPSKRGIGFMGLAPGASIYSARVFPDASTGANQGDIVRALDELSSEHECDLINLSLGSTTGSEIERDSILDAYERGTLCIAAAGNDGGKVKYPAAFQEVVAVSALGKLGWGPMNSVSAMNIPDLSDKFGSGNLYLANFSCHGTNIACAGGGVGIVSTVPDNQDFGINGEYAAMDGTSMASPNVTGLLASILSSDPSYIRSPRNALRADRAKTILLSKCQTVNLDYKYEGKGVPVL